MEIRQIRKQIIQAGLMNWIIDMYCIYIERSLIRYDSKEDFRSGFRRLEVYIMSHMKRFYTFLEFSVCFLNLKSISPIHCNSRKRATRDKSEK